jgi:hypothetical protein
MGLGMLAEPGSEFLQAQSLQDLRFLQGWFLLQASCKAAVQAEAEEEFSQEAAAAVLCQNIK